LSGRLAGPEPGAGTGGADGCGLGRVRQRRQAANEAVAACGETPPPLAARLLDR